jgi:hypothetical protein
VLAHAITVDALDVSARTRSGRKRAPALIFLVRISFYISKFEGPDAVTPPPSSGSCGQRRPRGSGDDGDRDLGAGQGPGQVDGGSTAS